ncbi:MAG: DUF1501 domain-containing protein, partial [Planctomycetota bacterium]|nr:DUF1501 domain-containing protein [Planctomycetota bacterium]
MAIEFSSIPVTSRRDFLTRTGAGFGSVALAGLMAQESKAAIPIDSLKPFAERMPHFAPKAKQVIFLFMYGGPSQVDLFDYKPDLIKLNGAKVPDSIKKQKDKVGGVFNACKDELMSGPWKWAQHGKSGLWVSSLLPETAKHADELCVVRSMFSESSNHAPATYLMNTGAILGEKPSLGSWVTYGLGSPNQNLPGYVLLFKVGGLGGSANWSNGFLPAAFQGTHFRHEGSPVLNLQPPEELQSGQRSTLDLIQQLNKRHAQARPGVLDLDGRIASYELAYRMQSEAMEIGELSNETSSIQNLYGIHDKNKDKATFARMCLTSRRLVEKGVRFVQLYNAVDKLGWDGHGNNHEFHQRNSAQTDGPIAALLTDLKQRGLLDSTLVVWAGEFGRTPMMQGGNGRNHNPYGFTIW